MGFVFQQLDSPLSVFLVSGTWIPYSYGLRDSGLPELNSEFQSAGFRILQTNIFRSPETGLRHMERDVVLDAKY